MLVERKLPKYQKNNLKKSKNYIFIIVKSNFNVKINQIIYKLSKKSNKTILKLPMIIKMNSEMTKEPKNKKVMNFQMELLFNFPNKQYLNQEKFYLHNLNQANLLYPE